jgi:hypothetical protein
MLDTTTSTDYTFSDTGISSDTTEPNTGSRKNLLSFQVKCGNNDIEEKFTLDNNMKSVCFGNKTLGQNVAKRYCKKHI